MLIKNRKTALPIGNCYDNAAAESFFKTLKSELVNEIGQYKNRKETRASILEYMEVLL